MARSRRGGSRQGVPGRPYPNRKDLRSASKQKQLPIKAASGQPYGVRKQQEEAQRAQPLPAAATPDFAGLLQAAEAFNPGERLPLDRPTERPEEPLTAGLPSGPGPGPEVLGLPPDSSRVSSILRRIALTSGSSDIEALADFAESQGQ
jgi:hypothetical protein